MNCTEHISAKRLDGGRRLPESGPDQVLNPESHHRNRE
jgi:hypothetical protein